MRPTPGRPTRFETYARETYCSETYARETYAPETYARETYWLALLSRVVPIIESRAALSPDPLCMGAREAHSKVTVARFTAAGDRRTAYPVFCWVESLKASPSAKTPV